MVAVAVETTMDKAVVVAVEADEAMAMVDGEDPCFLDLVSYLPMNGMQCRGKISRRSYVNERLHAVVPRPILLSNPALKRIKQMLDLQPRFKFRLRR